MIERKKKLRIIQGSLIAFGFIIFFFTYFNYDFRAKNKKIISENIKEKVSESLVRDSKDSDGLNIFYNIQYSGLDASGNRYILKSKEAYTDELNDKLINMKYVDAFFYFKDDTVLTVNSEKGEYNNNTLDIKFFGNIKADYQNSKLYAGEAEYSNSKNFIIIKKNVKINNPKGNLFADKLLFDIKNQNLNITSFKNSKINANIDLNEKRF